MSRPVQDKREFYRQREVTDSYDRQRFGGASGARVNAREMELVLSMLPDQGRLLDLACGTGRLTQVLVASGRPVVALDSSPAMAAYAAAAGAPTVIGDAFGAPFADCSFAAIVSLRLAFHYRELEPLLREMRRLVAPGGNLVFDTCSWSPRAGWDLGASRWGGRVYLHSRRQVAAVATGLNLHVERAQPCFLVSPYLYRLAPLPLERALEALEARTPRSWRSRVFWKLRRQ